jgi:hypothetical protein
MSRARDTFDWNDATIAQLKALMAQKVSYPEIGRRLGTSKCSVANKARRLGLCKPPPSPTGQYIGRRAEMKAAPKVRELQEKMREQKLRIMLTAPPTMHRRAAESCMYVLQVGPPAKYCDAPTAPGKSMCQTHCTICYVPRERHHFDLAV